MVNNIEAVQWALELYGFKDVNIKVRHQKAFTIQPSLSNVLAISGNLAVHDCAQLKMSDVPVLSQFAGA